MADTYYGSAAGVRRLNRKITTAHIVDADIVTIATSDTKPVVDAALDGHGAPFTSAAAIVGVIADLFTAAQIFDDVFSQSGDESGVAAKYREHAWDLISRIKSGEMTASGLTTVSPHSAVDPADDRLDEEEFVDKGRGELDWEHTEEERESD